MGLRTSAELICVGLMTEQILILGGSGRIGSNVAADIVAHTQAQVTITGRDAIAGQAVSDRLSSQVQFLALDLAESDKLREAISQSQLVIHCAGPFPYRDASVLKTCIDLGVDYLDVSDHRSFTCQAVEYKAEATAAGVTAIVNTGIFPGISNSMVRRDVEQLDQPERIHLSYVVGGSGGAGITVMRTTFLGLRRPFDVWKDNQWQQIKPYSDREAIQFPAPYGRTGVYWFDMPEAFTLPDTFPEIKTVVTKFGTVPDFYNYLTWSVAHWWPSSWLRNAGVIEFLSQVSHGMTDVTDRFSGIGVAIRSEVSGQKAGEAVRCCSTLVHENTAIAAGYGTGTLAELMLAGKLKKPGVWPVEQALPTDLFEQVMASRGLKIEQTWEPIK
jgi:saccharopine dehydrogenase-like NADP-dependent oxidoreductase